MARDAETPDIEELELGGDDAPAIDPNEPQTGDDGDDPAVNDEEETLTFGDEADEQDDDSKLVKHLRNEIRERDRRLAEAARATPREEPVEIGPKPTMADEGIEFDEDKYDAAMEVWRAAHAGAKRRETTAAEADEEQRREWDARLQKVASEKAALGKADVDDAFETVKAALGEERAAAILYAAEEGNAAKLMYALGKHPARLAELALQTDPVRFVKAVAKLEGQLKVVKGRTRAIDPDTPERGSARVSSQGKDKTLEKLEKDAERTGDRTKLISYKRDKAAKK
jgi:hypothetical protein